MLTEYVTKYYLHITQVMCTYNCKNIQYKNIQALIQVIVQDYHIFIKVSKTVN